LNDDDKSRNTVMDAGYGTAWKRECCATWCM